MKKLANAVVIFTGIILGLILISACEEESNESGLLTDSTSAYSETADPSTTFVETEELGQSEIDMLLHMKEEEKLARDVYDVLYTVWGSRVFDNISASEQKHVDAVLELISFYDLDDTELSEPGIFTDSALQDLYNALVEQGSTSIEEAMKVGATIEDLDIYDLQILLQQTENANITLVFNNLLAGSGNHMRAFNNQLESLGLNYEPGYISQEEFEEIILSENTRGNGSQMTH